MNPETIIKAGQTFLELRQVVAVTEHRFWGGSLVTLMDGRRLHVGVHPVELVSAMRASATKYAPATAVYVRQAVAR